MSFKGRVKKSPVKGKKPKKLPRTDMWQSDTEIEPGCGTCKYRQTPSVERPCNVCTRNGCVKDKHKKSEDKCPGWKLCPYPYMSCGACDRIDKRVEGRGKLHVRVVQEPRQITEEELDKVKGSFWKEMGISDPYVCQYCHGTGKSYSHSHELDCPECGGSGRKKPKRMKVIRVTGCQPMDAPPKFTGCPYHMCFDKDDPCLEEDKDKLGKCWCSLRGKEMEPSDSMSFIPEDCPLENYREVDDDD